MTFQISFFRSSSRLGNRILYSSDSSRPSMLGLLEGEKFIHQKRGKHRDRDGKTVRESLCILHKSNVSQSRFKDDRCRPDHWEKTKINQDEVPQLLMRGLARVRKYKNPVQYERHRHSCDVRECNRPGKR